ncbi:CBASS cGAMP-activated phospholipase [Gilliamella sp. CG16]|uniref:CBASS cGAMP-activated phospholipase n=1 Tax=Gilliamella sp. CG16 TaxID=3351503 RepID=UPI003987A319
MKKKENKERFRILALSGGGYRGLYTAKVLADIEEYLNDQSDSKDRYIYIGEYFDLVTGTSIGGILALAVAYRIKMKDVVKLFKEKGATIFCKQKRSFWKIVKAKYTQDGLTKVLKEWFGDNTIVDLKNNVVIPAIDYSQGRPVTFKTPHHPNFVRDWKLKIKDVALCTSAAPTFFKRHSIDKNEYVDGGLFANNPALIGLHEAEFFFKKKIEDIYMLSIGTLSDQKNMNPSTNKLGGFSDWGEGNILNAANNIIDLTFSAQQQFMLQLVTHRMSDYPDHFFQIDEKLVNASANYVALDATDTHAQQVLESNGMQSAKKALGIEEIRVFFDLPATSPIRFNR